MRKEFSMTKLITETEVQDLVNRLIDLKNEHKTSLDSNEISWRSHGINMAVILINGRLLGEYSRSHDFKYEREPAEIENLTSYAAI